MTRTKSTYLAALAVLLSPMAANADPITFSFEYPVWEIVFDSALFGTHPILTIKLDNGSSSFLNQTYNLSTDVIELAVSVAGGTYSNSWLGSETYSVFGGSYDFISTNAGGIPILDLVTNRDSRVAWSNSGGTWQIGASPSFTQSWLSSGPAFAGNTAYHGGGISTVITGSTATVPEPGTLALLGIGLFGMGLARRNKKA